MKWPRPTGGMRTGVRAFVRCRVVDEKRARDWGLIRPSPNTLAGEEAREIVEAGRYILVLAAFCAEALSMAIVTTASTAAL